MYLIYFMLYENSNFPKSRIFCRENFLIQYYQFSTKFHSQTPDERTPLHPVELSTELMLACTVALSPSNSLKQTHPKVLERLPDLIR